MKVIIVVRETLTAQLLEFEIIPVCYEVTHYVKTAILFLPKNETQLWRMLTVKLVD